MTGAGHFIVAPSKTRFLPGGSLSLWLMIIAMTDDTMGPAFPFSPTCAPAIPAQRPTWTGNVTFNPFQIQRLSDEDVERIAKRVAELLKP